MSTRVLKLIDVLHIGAKIVRERKKKPVEFQEKKKVYKVNHVNTKKFFFWTNNMGWYWDLMCTCFCLSNRVRLPLKVQLSFSHVLMNCIHRILICYWKKRTLKVLALNCIHYINSNGCKSWKSKNFDKYIMPFKCCILYTRHKIFMSSKNWVARILLSFVVCCYQYLIMPTLDFSVKPHSFNKFQLNNIHFLTWH